MNQKEIDNIFENLTPEERAEAFKILDEIKNSETGESELLDELYLKDYYEKPVDIDTFIDSEQYAGWFTNNGKDIYPFWKNHLKNIFSTNESYSEIAITGGIGTGKSHIAVLSLAYALYRLMCLKDPHSYFNIAKGGYIYVVFFNATLQLSQGVAYTKFQSLLQNSPWFMERGKVVGLKNLEYVPNGPIRFTVGSQMEHSIGKDILLGLLDEVNFVKGADVQMEKSKIMQLYNSVLERINSRFIVRGRVEGKLFLVSSKKSSSDFIESYINKQKGKKGIYIVDSKIWEVKPKGTYSGVNFLVASGGVTKKPLIISDEETTWEFTMDDGTIKKYHLGDKVQLSNGKIKNIEDIKVGDSIV